MQRCASVSLLVALFMLCPRSSAGGLTAEVFANSVMRGTPVCTTSVANGFSASASSLCGHAHSAALLPGQYSIRLTGTLTAASASPQWYKITSTVGPTAMVRLWVDDHRLVDAWNPRSPPSPVPPAAPAGYSVVPSTNMPSEVGEFGGKGKVYGVGDDMSKCAVVCESLRAQGCVGWVYSAPSTCYMRRPAQGKSCPDSIVYAPLYAVYTRNASCTFPAGWKPAGKPPGPPGPPPAPDTPTTPGLSANVTLASSRPVFVRVDLRPMHAAHPVMLTLKWSSDPGAIPVQIPPAALAPTVSAEQQKRRALQEQASMGWNHWQRSSQLSLQALPQQFGVQLGVQHHDGTATYSQASKSQMI